MSSQSSRHTQLYEELNCDSLVNLSLLDPPRWGWSALGGITDLLPPHERARRLQSQRDFQVLKYREKKKREEQEKLKKKDTPLPSSGETVCGVPPSEATKNAPSCNINSVNILKGNADSLVNTNVVNGSLGLNVDEVKLSDKEISENDEKCPVSSSDPGQSYIKSNDTKADHKISYVDCSLSVASHEKYSENVNIATVNEDLYLHKDKIERGTTVHEKDPVASDFSPHGATLERNVVDNAVVLESSKATNPKVSNEHAVMHVESSVVQLPEKTVPQDTKVVVSSEADPLEETTMHVSIVAESIELDPTNAMVDPSQMPPLGERIPQGTVLTESCEMQPMKKNTVQGERIPQGTVLAESCEMQPMKKNTEQGVVCAELGETKVGMENIEHRSVVTASSEVQLPETSNVQGPDLAALGGVQSTKECKHLHAIDITPNEGHHSAKRIIEGPGLSQLDQGGHLKENIQHGTVDVMTGEGKTPESRMQQGHVYISSSVVKPPKRDIEQGKADDVAIAISDEMQGVCVPATQEFPIGNSAKVPSFDAADTKNSKSQDCNSIDTKNVKKSPSKSLDYNFGPNYNVIHKPKGRSKRDKFDIEIKAVQPDGVVHPDAYHRGIVGEEPRCKLRGNLLCDTEPTDTNHGWDEPHLKLSIKVEFPLCDPEWSEDEIGEVGNGVVEDLKEEMILIKRDTRKREGRKYLSAIEKQVKREEKMKNVPYFCEDVEWDLSNPKTPTPILYATDIAAEFGLSFCSMLDLARSIQSQIDTFLRDSVNYHTPISVKDHLLAPRGKNSLQPPKYSYPKVLHGGHCATDITTASKCFEAVEPKKERSSSCDRKKQVPKRKNIKSKHSNRHNMPTTKLDIVRARDHPDQLLENVDFDEIHVRDFLKRAKMENQRITQKLADGNIGTVKIVQNMNCHFCHKRRSKGVQFICGTESHCFCDVHSIKRFGLSIDDIVSKDLDYCPVCCLECPCCRCKGKISSLVPLFLKECKRQGVSSNDVEFDFTFHCNRNLWKLEKSDVRNASASSFSRQTIEKNVEISSKSLQQVPKIPREDFPAEMTHGINRDPSMKDDYNTIFTPEGATVCTDVITSSNDSKEDSTNTAIEDGNVDYCSECQKTGDIICCDVCPRGFHAVCLALDTSTLAGRWECPRCLQDSTQQPQDLVEGTYYLDKLKTVFEQFSSTSDFEQKVGTLSKIFDAIKVLTEYEFGDIFSEPVDVKAVRDYKKYVKRPMDLGTITSRLLKGSYCKASSRTKDPVSADGITEMDVVILNVLKDIEQIWHNCFLYNREGSSFYRMGQVLQRKFSVIRRASFEKELNPFIIGNLSIFLDECKVKRQDLSNSLKPWIPKSKYHINISNKGPSNKTVIGIFDKDTKMVVKQYSSMTSACSVAEFLSNLGHKSEIAISSKQKVREYIMSMQEKPSLLLFGYRWLLMENIRSGNFELEYKPQSEIFQKKCKISNSVLEEFDSLTCAYESWLNAIERCVSIVQLKDFDRSVDCFQKLFLDGNSTIDSMEWVRIHFPGGTKGTLVNIKHPNPSEHKPEGNVTSQVIKNNSNEQITSFKDSNNADVKGNDVKPITNGSVETGKHSIQGNEKHLMMRLECQKFTKVPCHETREENMHKAVFLTNGSESVEPENYDVYSSESKSKNTVDDKSQHAGKTANVCEIPNSSKDVSATTFDEYSKKESDQRLPSKEHPEFPSPIHLDVSRQNTKSQNDANAVDNFIENRTMSTSILSGVLNTSDNNDSIESISAAKSVANTVDNDSYFATTTGLATATSETGTTCDQWKPGLLHAGDNYSGIPHGISDKSNNNESTLRLSGEEVMRHSKNDSSLQNASIDAVSGVLNTTNNHDSSQRVSATELLLGADNNDSFRKTTTSASRAVLDIPSTDTSSRSLLGAPPLLSTGKDHSKPNASIGMSSGNDANPNIPPRMPPAVFNTLKTMDTSSQILSTIGPTCDTSNDCSYSNACSGMATARLGVLNNDAPAQRSLRTTNGASFPNPSSSMHPGISHTCNNHDSTCGLPTKESISAISYTQNNNDSTQRRRVPISSAGLCYPDNNNSIGMPSAMLDTSNLNESTQRLVRTASPIDVTGASDHPHQYESSTMSGMSQEGACNQLLPPSPGVLHHQDALQGNNPMTYNNQDTLQPEISGASDVNKVVISLRSRHEQSEGSMKSNESLVGTTASQPSALEEELVASLLHFAGAITPSISLRKRPIDDSDKTSGITQSKKQCN